MNKDQASPSEAELQQRLMQLETLLVLSRVLSSTLDLPTLLDLIVKSGREMTDCEACSLLLLDSKSGELYFEAASGGAREIKRVVVPLDSSVAGWVCRAGKVLVIGDTTQDTRFYRQADAESLFTTRSILAAPLKVKDKIIGCLEAINKRVGVAFGEDDTEILTTLASQAAVAIQNARLFEQSDQIAQMVHELRTPLTGIVAYSELLMRPGLQPEMTVEFAGTIHAESTRLAQFINDFLDLARLESGRARIAFQMVDMHYIVRETVQIVQPKAAEMGLTLAGHVPDGLPMVRGDAARLKQILINLVSNAIKYNRPGGSVEVVVEPRDREALVHVKDTGKGIPAESLPHMFEKFYRVPDSEGWAAGTGLGLSIVKQLVEAHGGHIQIESQVGVGTTVSFSVPLMPVSPDT
jgi:signal transduction histidine kinase